MIKHPKNRYERLRIKKVKEFGKTKGSPKGIEQEGPGYVPLEIEVGESYRTQPVERDYDI